MHCYSSQLIIEFEADRTFQAVYMDSIDNIVFEPCGSLKFFVIFSYPVIHTALVGLFLELELALTLELGGTVELSVRLNIA